MTHILKYIGGIWKVGLAELVDPGFWSVDLWICGFCFIGLLDPCSKLRSAVSIDQLAKKNAAGRRMTPVHGRS